ncbi:hypothetical protein ACFPYI_07010 [Halomarina salina]|uniref:Secreted protein n=1 Tax=Halomarina salina TaxID=1872699 RepID=A0ABD5RL26_9EURY|nr:hypothetical protein [Halomarina salina]
MRTHGPSSDAPDAAETDARSSHGPVAGLSLAADGLRLVTDRTTFEPGVPADLTFRLVDDHGHPVEAFEESHGRRSHLVVVRRDLVAFQHLHPKLDDAGTWHCEGFTLPQAGVFRAFVDVVVDGRATTLGLDLFAPGVFEIDEARASADRHPDDEFEVELDHGSIEAGDVTRLTFSVSRRDGTVPDVRPYLGARGHLVALRAGDLAYLHVHPTETADEGSVEFAATFPTPGEYRLFLQTDLDGTLVTRAIDVEV